MNDKDDIPSSWTSDYVPTCVEQHPGFCRASVDGDEHFWKDHEILCLHLKHWPAATLFRLEATVAGQQVSNVFLVASNDHSDRIVLARCALSQGVPRVMVSDDKGIDFMVTQTLLKEVWDKGRPDALQLVRCKSLPDTLESLARDVTLNDVVAGMPWELLPVSHYVLLPVSLRTCTSVNKDEAARVKFSPEFQHMESLFKSLRPDFQSKVDTDEHFDDAAVAGMETEFARAKKSSQKLRTQKLKATVKHMKRRKPPVRLREPHRQERQVQDVDEAFAPAAKISRRLVEDVNLDSFGPFALKRIWSRGVFTSVSAECKLHRTAEDCNDCARSIKVSERVPLNEAVLKLKKWLVSGAAIDEELLNNEFVLFEG